MAAFTVEYNSLRESTTYDLRGKKCPLSLSEGRHGRLAWKPVSLTGKKVNGTESVSFGIAKARLKDLLRERSKEASNDGTFVVTWSDGSQYRFKAPAPQELDRLPYHESVNRGTQAYAKEAIPSLLADALDTNHSDLRAVVGLVYMLELCEDTNFESELGGLSRQLLEPLVQGLNAAKSRRVVVDGAPAPILQHPFFHVRLLDQFANQFVVAAAAESDPARAKKKLATASTFYARAARLANECGFDSPAANAEADGIRRDILKVPLTLQSSSSLIALSPPRVVDLSSKALETALKIDLRSGRGSSSAGSVTPTVECAHQIEIVRSVLPNAPSWAQIIHKISHMGSNGTGASARAQQAGFHRTYAVDLAKALRRWSAAQRQLQGGSSTGNNGAVAPPVLTMPEEMEVGDVLEVMREVTVREELERLRIENAEMRISVGQLDLKANIMGAAVIAFGVLRLVAGFVGKRKEARKDNDQKVNGKAQKP